MQEIHTGEIKILTKLIKANYGYDFTDYAISSFKRRIIRFIDHYKLKNIAVLIKKIGDDPLFFKVFISEITVNVTEMYRDPSFWRFLKKNIIPNILLNQKKICIWHAGCSSGEEVYSMVILLKEIGILEGSKIIATDIDDNILACAQSGIYTLKSMEINEENYVRFGGECDFNKYFTIKNGFAHMDKTLVNNVSFQKHDLVNGIVLNKFDIVLCRNVMIYFNQYLQNEVMKKLHESILKHGYLSIGSKESLIWCENASKFSLVTSEEKVYKKIKE